MRLPLYSLKNQQHQMTRPPESNTGLWFTRFYNQFDKDWSVEDNGKRSWIDAVADFCGDSQLLEATSSRIEKLGKALNAEIADFKTDANFATGLGLSHPVENGFTWHHTLGVPYLPASGVKGLLRGWVEAWMTPQNDGDREPLIQRWFGMAKDSDSVADRAGGLIFFDALPTTRITLVTEIMTPHAGKWYEQGGNIASVADYTDKAPADWHSPVPVPFLAVGRGASFRFMIAPRLTGDAAVDAQARQDCREAIAQLALALEWMGAGAKTATGYGRMSNDNAKRQAELAAAGIETNTTQWVGAKVTRNKSTGELNVVSAQGKQVAQVKAPLAQAIFNGLSEAMQKKLKEGKKPLTMTATVEIIGNLTQVHALDPEA